MDKATYISRKVMDRYMDKVTQRLGRLWKRIVKLESRLGLVEDRLGLSDKED